MPSNPEAVAARKWLIENRPELGVSTRGRLKPEWVDEYNEHKDDEVIQGEFVDDLELKTDEIPPTRPKPKESKVKKFFTPKAKTGRARGRASTEVIWSGLYSVLSKVTAMVPGSETNPVPLLPVAKVMEFQAPAVGILIDESINNTVVDKIVQPLARVGKGGETAWAIIGPPVLVGAMMQSPELRPVLYPYLRESLKSYMVLAGPAIKKREEKERKLMEQMGDNYEGDLDKLVEYLFAPPPNMGSAYNGTE